MENPRTKSSLLQVKQHFPRYILTPRRKFYNFITATIEGVKFSGQGDCQNAARHEVAKLALPFALKAVRPVRSSKTAPKEFV